jgi:hypothetical protein
MTISHSFRLRSWWAAQDEFLATQGVIMKSFLSTKLVAAAALSAAALGAASAAQANPNVYFSVGFQGPAVYAEPAPVYVQPRPVYVQPRPVYVQPRPAYVAPPVFVFGRPWFSSYDRRHEDERGWHRAEWQRHDERQHHWAEQPSHDRH